MTKPEPYILQEWTSMCARAKRSANSDCPLIEDEVILVMSEYMIDMQFRIKALEFTLNILSQRDEE